MMNARIHGAVCFERLEQALVSDLGEFAADPSRRVWVLVPTNILAQHLAGVPARACGGLMGVRCLTLRDAARAVAIASLARRGMRPVPPGAAELVLEQALRRLPADAHFCGLSDFPGSVDALIRAVALLKHSLWSPATLTQAAMRLRNAEPQLARRLGELAFLWEEWEGFKKDRALFDDEDLLLEAARSRGNGTGAGGAPTPDALFLYGFYDLTALQRKLVRAVARTAHTLNVYLLWDERDSVPRRGFEYAAATVEFFRALCGAREVELLGDVPGQSDLCRLRRGIFAERPARKAAGESEAAPSPAGDGTVRVVHCGGETAEVEEIGREVLRRFRSGSGSLSVCALARAADAVAEELSEVFERAGIAYCMAEGRPLAGTNAARIVLALLALADGEAERSELIEFLSVAHVSWPEGLHATALDRLSRLASIVKGWDAWPETLARWAESQDHQAAGAEQESEQEALRAQAELARAAAQFLRGFFAAVRGLSSAASWRAMAEELCRLADRFIPPQEEGRADVLDHVRALRALDLTGLPADVGRAARLLRRALARAARKTGRFLRCAVTCADVMSSRGATYDVVVVPRLLEKSFPRQIPGDPLLSDGNRKALNTLCGEFGAGKLPLQQMRPQEERYLFRLALGSARRAVVLSYPRIEQDTGRPLVPSRFVLEACSVLCGGRATPERIEEGTLGDLVRRVRLGPLRNPADALDAWEYDLAQHLEAAQSGLAAAYTLRLSDRFRMALQMQAGRWSQRELGPYDGNIRAPRLLERLAETYCPRGQPVSPSRLEAYALCPFSYFLRYVLGIEELDKPVEEPQIPPLAWGRMVHDVYRAVYARRLAGRALGELTDAEIEEALRFASREFERVGASYAAALPCVWAASRQRGLEELRGVLILERAQNGDAVPERFEFAFGLDERGGGFAMEVGPGEAIQLHGRIDRVDALGADGMQVLDYKSGASATRGYRKDSFEGGVQLQLPLYLLAASHLLGRREGRARYLFIAERRFVDEFTLEELRRRRCDLQRIVRLIREGIASGNFFLLPPETRAGAEHCEKYCPYASVCSPARAKLAQIKNHRANARDLKPLWDLRGIR